MAPKGGSSGGRKGGGISVNCPGAFQDYGDRTIPYFAAYCFFFLVIIGLFVATSKAKKGSPSSKKLLGPIFLISLFCALIDFGLGIINNMLVECRTINSYQYYDGEIARIIFERLDIFLLLVLAVYNVNDVLRQHHGQRPGYLKIVYGIILVFMGVLTCAFIGVTSYNYSQIANGENRLYDQELNLMVAYYVLYMVSVVAAGTVAAITIFSMRARVVRGLTGWTAAFFCCMFAFAVFNVAEDSLYLNLLGYDHYKATQALAWLEYFSQVFSWFCIISIAKIPVIASGGEPFAAPQIYNTQPPTYVPVPQQTQPPYAPVPQQGYQQSQQLPYTVHSGPPPPQPQYYYQQQPAYNGTPSPVNGYTNGPVVQGN